ncbi:hypothetical protein K501DRAFT_199541 [Backusella circina FSU 941]|nr:hypothetical protein K501DRAFT_199541 [Backusella circina FSU 941]
MVFIKPIITLAVAYVSSTAAASVASISSCPALTPRATAAKDVTDLRIDDIGIVAGLGDSIMAGFAMMGVDYNATGALNLSLISEYRGNSYAMGVDTGAVTLPNFVKHYNSKVQGGSILSHIVSYCQGTTCGFPETLYRPLRDILNGAQSGGLAMNLDYELDYLIPRMKLLISDSDFQNVWKMVTIQIGSNDQCASCGADYASNVTANAYSGYVEAAIERIKENMPKTVVNLLGTFKVSGVFPLSAGQSYCVPNGILENKKECECSSSAENLASMDALSDAYNVKLQAIADKYKGVAGGTFAVMYSPAPIQISSFPIDALSNVDCFHPSLKGHQWIAKSFWNQMFLNASSKPSTMTFSPDLEVNCPVDTDRLPTQ